jgi:hypothetical protein
MKFFEREPAPKEARETRPYDETYRNLQQAIGILEAAKAKVENYDGGSKDRTPNTKGERDVARMKLFRAIESLEKQASQVVQDYYSEDSEPEETK